MYKSLVLGSTFVVLLSVGCAARTDEPIGTSTDPIIGGTVDNGDPAIVAVVAIDSLQSKFRLCTGEVISPHVILTAGHCVLPDITTGSFASSFEVLTGTRVNAPTAVLAVSAVHAHPLYNPLSSGENDVGVVILTAATTITPLVYNQSPTLIEGTPARIVGYGTTQDGNSDTLGVKNTADGALTQISTMHFLPATAPVTKCHGDSGGPTLIQSGGQNVIVGLSWQTVDPNGSCGMGVRDTRVDPFASWINDQVAAAEGGGLGSILIGDRFHF